MEEATGLLRKFCEETGCTGAFAATRSGNFICGKLPEGQHRDTFVAMTAIIHGGAETISMELKRPLETVSVNYQGGTMTVLGLGTKAILAVAAKSFDKNISEGLKAVAKELEKFIQ